MQVHKSNRIENLLDVLVKAVSRPLPSPTAPECIVVQGRGMERFLSMELCKRLGVWANAEFPFPRRIVEGALDAVLGRPEGQEGVSQSDVMMWAIAALLPRFVEHKAFAPIRRYLQGDDGAHRRIQLAARIADVFDDYVVYRPEMVLGWERGNEADDWQAVLWRALTERYGSNHIAARAESFLEAVEHDPDGIELGPDFPHRLLLFRVGSLPPLYLKVFFALSRIMEVQLFVLSPSRHPPHTGEGNPLLASLGGLSRDFQQLIEETGAYEQGEQDLYHDPGTDSMLGTLQSDILHMRHRGGGSDQAARLLLHEDDDSISVHACHGPMRQIEVLHDQLMALFDRDPSLMPRDVVVMMPEVEPFAPLIEAVFGAGTAQRPRIPFCIADRGVRATDEVFDAFYTLLEVMAGRMTASEVLDLLNRESIRSLFDIGVDEMEQIHRWVSESGVRWGVDAEHRRSLGQPGFDDFTWRLGLDRLLLGYAVPGDGQRLYEGRLPYDDVEGSAADAVGRLVEFCETLFEFRQRLEKSRKIPDWTDELGELLERMVAVNGQTSGQHRAIRDALFILGEHTRAAGFEEPLQLMTVRGQLERVLNNNRPALGFLSGGVTFCEFVPMRSIPFRVVCLLGMNHDALRPPRRSPGFDRIAQQPRTGDRLPRDETRHPFLEALLSARQRIIICYQGQDSRDNKSFPPSILVDELLDTLGESYRAKRGENSAETDLAGEQAQAAIRRCLVVRHPLQPFSPRYFRQDIEPELFSYTRSYLQGARACLQERQPPPPFLSGPLPPDETAPAAIELEQLLRFFRHPVKHLLQKRFGLYLEEPIESIADREPALLDDSLEIWRIGDELLKRALQGQRPDRLFDSIRAAGRLPPGTPGRCAYDALAPQVENVAAAAERFAASRPLPSIAFERELDGFVLQGRIDGLRPGGQVQIGFSRVGGSSELELWIRHLLLSWLAPPAVPQVSLLVGRAEKGASSEIIRFKPVSDAGERVRALVRLYQAGQAEPLPFFPRASRAYARTLADGSGKGDRRHKALLEARRVLAGGPFSAGDSSDPYIEHLCGHSDPLDPDERAVAFAITDVERFEKVALEVFGPLLQHREQQS